MDLIDFQQVFDESLEDLVHLLKIPSIYDEASASAVMPYGKAVYDALSFMKDIAQKDGFEVLEYDGHAIAIRYRDHCEKRIDIPSHLDVVEVGDGWVKDPFGAVIENGRLYGRGTQDMKTCAWLTYLSLKLLKQYHPDLPCEIRIVLGCDEERTMNDMRYYLSKAGKPDFAFTPDGYFPMGIGEKGALMWRLKGKYEGIIEMLAGGVQCNVIAPSATAVLKHCVDHEKIHMYLDEHAMQGDIQDKDGKSRITIYGKAAHASRPWLGHNATVDLLQLLGDVLEDTWAKAMAICFHDPYGAGCELAFDIAPMGKLTMNLGVLRIQQGECYGEVDCRYPYGVTSKECTKRLSIHAPVSISLDYDDPPTLCDENDPYVKTLLKVYRSSCDDQSEPLISGGVSYSKVFGHCVTFGPARAGHEMLAHQANEYVELADCAEYLKIYYEAIKAIAYV